MMSEEEAVSPDVSKEHTDRDLFLYRLPPEWTEDDIKEKFSDYGEVVSAKVAKRPDGASRGFGFVCFSKTEDAREALAKMDGQMLGNSPRRLKVSLKKTPQQVMNYQVSKLLNYSATSDGARAATTLFVFHLPGSWDDAKLREQFSPFGTVASAKVQLSEDDKTSKGYGFVTYNSPNAAARALQNMSGFQVEGKRLKVSLKQSMSGHGMDPRSSASPRGPYSQAPVVPSYYVAPASYPPHPGYANPMPVSPSGPVRPPGGPGGGGGNQEQLYTLFVFHLPQDWADSNLLRLFSRYGRVASAKVQRESSTGDSKGFGFVSFYDLRDAVLSLQQLDGYAAGSKHLKVSIKKGEEGLFPQLPPRGRHPSGDMDPAMGHSSFVPPPPGPYGGVGYTVPITVEQLRSLTGSGAPMPGGGRGHDAPPGNYARTNWRDYDGGGYPDPRGGPGSGGGGRPRNGGGGSYYYHEGARDAGPPAQGRGYRYAPY